MKKIDKDIFKMNTKKEIIGDITNIVEDENLALTMYEDFNFDTLIDKNPGFVLRYHSGVQRGHWAEEIIRMYNRKQERLCKQ